MTAKTRTSLRPTGRYDFHAVEASWRPRWQADQLYRTTNDSNKPNIYILDYFPYPSGDGLSVGHCRNYIPSCVSARFHRMRGFNVLHPMGWDAFGLPAENYAIAHGVHPRETTTRFVANYRRQMELIECSYDWSREINSTDPAYYRWTQWFFLLLFRRGLAYRARGSQWWCPDCRTILANEQVEDGRCWRCDSMVKRKELEQWYFRITDFAERLLDDLNTVDWPERIKRMQSRWIGRSEGTEVVFPMGEESITTFTSRPDTLYGVTFLAMAPEHPMAGKIAVPEKSAEVADYIRNARGANEIERLPGGRSKTGVFTGAYARHPLTGEPIPVWIADYVVTGYGSDAVMGVPGHDQRDFDFARRYGLPIIEVVRDANGSYPAAGGRRETGQELTAAFEGEGVTIESGPFSGLSSAGAAARISEELAERGLGGPKVAYRLRDWLISRQRYWGAPMPIIHCPACGIVPVPESDLPVVLPEISDFSPPGDGRSPLARAADWVNTRCPQCGGPAQRETDTMDGFACSSWYFLRFASPREGDRPFDPEAVRDWLPVDTYIGGAEHAVMHLLYARFWTKVIYDAGMIDFVEPFTQLRNQGMLLSAEDGLKMSKSKGNVVTPDEIVVRYGVDATRVYVLFLGPFDADVVWSKRGIIGVQRFLDRYWKLATGLPPGSATTFDERFERDRHRIIRRVTDDMARFRFNTAVAALMEYVNDLYAARARNIGAAQWRNAIRSVTLLLAPIAPFVTEEVWREVLGEAGSVHRADWPEYDEDMTTDDHVTIVIQVNGKLRDRIQMPDGVDEATMRGAALANDKARSAIGDRPVGEVFVVPGRLVNIVTK